MLRSLFRRAALDGLSSCRWFLAVAALLCANGPLAAPAHAAGELEITVVDADTQLPIPALIKLTDQRGRSPHPRGLTGVADRLFIDGSAVLRLPDGTYQFEITRGPGYREQFGNFRIDKSAEDNHTVALQRVGRSKRSGTSTWWSGDVNVGPPTKTLEAAALGNDLNVVGIINRSHGDRTDDETDPDAPAVANWMKSYFGDSRVELVAGSGGCLLFWSPDERGRPDETVTTPQTPMARLQSKSPDQLAHIEDCTSWEVPLWLATEAVDSVTVFRPPGSDSSKASGSRPTKHVAYQGVRGWGRYQESIFFEMLNAGLRIAPVASSGGSTQPQAGRIGDYRTYVSLGNRLPTPPTADDWWLGIKEGKTVVSTGPLMTPTVNGEAPGYVFQGTTGQTISLNARLTLSTRNRIEYLELIKNGKSVEEVRLQDWQAAGGILPPVNFDASGWFMIRAITNESTRYDVVCSAPCYVEFDGQPRISKAACEYFYQWLRDALKHAGEVDPATAKRQLDDYRRARDWWRERIASATSE